MNSSRFGGLAKLYYRGLQASLRPTATTQYNNNQLSLTGGLRCFSSPPGFTEIPAVFDRIRQVTNPAIVKKVNAIYVFDVEGEGKWHVDLSGSGSGSVGEGEPPSKPDVTVSVNKENFLKMFNRELKPATAFMSGQLKLSGDLSKALALESVMKASRDEF